MEKSPGYKEELDKINDIIIYIDSYEGDELDIRTLVEDFFLMYKESIFDSHNERMQLK